MLRTHIFVVAAFWLGFLARTDDLESGPFGIIAAILGAVATVALFVFLILLGLKS